MLFSAHPHVPTQAIAEYWASYHLRDLNKAHLRFHDIEPVINALAEHPNIQLTKLGESCGERPIYRLSLGSGPLTILAWTQMHGDEPTATAAVLDWLELLIKQSINSIPADWQSLVTLHIIPMLNPDGAERCTRVNQQGIDINRDAKQLQTPEGNILWEQVNQLKPDIAFNLHDQNPYYSAGDTPYPSTVAFLAPAFHPEKHVDAPRLRAKQLIACMADTLGHWLPHHIARYDDTYSLRSFGDNIAATGASTILIESGAYPNDPHRQVARKMNVIALQSALEALLNNQYLTKSLADYYRIPDNIEDGLTDLKFLQVTQQCGRKTFQADISVRVNKQGNATINHIGDLSTQHSFKLVPGSLHKIIPLKGKTLTAQIDLTTEKYKEMLRDGYCYFIGKESLVNNCSDWPVYCSETALGSGNLLPGHPAFWIMQDNRQIKTAVLNGKVFELS